MSNSIFPTLVGEGFPIKKPMHSTDIQTSQSGNEVRIANWAQERYSWAIPFNYLNDDPNVATADLQIIEGFYNAMHGRFDTFLYSDPRDNFVTASIIGTGDGAKTTFQLSRTRGASSHWIYNVNNSTAAPKIFLNGVLKTVTSDYSINSSGLVTFTSAPGAGVIITVEFYYYFRVRFDEDAVEMTEEAGPYWSIKQILLMEVANNR